MVGRPAGNSGGGSGSGTASGAPGGFEAYVAHQFATAAPKGHVTGGDHRFVADTMTPQDKARQMEQYRTEYANMSDGDRQQWEDHAAMKDVRSSRELGTASGGSAVPANGFPGPSKLAAQPPTSSALPGDSGTTDANGTQHITTADGGSVTIPRSQPQTKFPGESTGIFDANGVEQIKQADGTFVPKAAAATSANNTSNQAGTSSASTPIQPPAGATGSDVNAEAFQNQDFNRESANGPISQAVQDKLASAPPVPEMDPADLSASKPVAPLQPAVDAVKGFFSGLAPASGDEYGSSADYQPPAPAPTFPGPAKSPSAPVPTSSTGMLGVTSGASKQPSLTNNQTPTGSFPGPAKSAWTNPLDEEDEEQGSGMAFPGMGKKSMMA